MGAGVLIVGAGPAGLATAAALRGRGVEARLVDRYGVAGGAYARMDPEILMTTPSRLVSLPGLQAPREKAYLTAAEYARYLAEYGERTGLTVERGEVVELERASGGGEGYVGRIEARGERGTETERAGTGTGTGTGEKGETWAVVVLATGMFDVPVRPRIEGLPEDGAATAARPRVVHAANWRVAEAKEGERVIVIGDASSAVEIAEACARAGSVVSISVRDRVAISPATVLGVDPTLALMPLLARLPPFLARSFCRGRVKVPAADRGFGALREQGRIVVVPAVARVDGRTVALVDGRRLAVDVIVLATGYRHATAPAPRDLARDERGLPRTRDGESRSHPGLFVVGAPCARRAASQYVYGMALDAPAIADAIARRLRR